MAKRVNPLKSKFFGAVACPKTSLAEFSHPSNQRMQAWCRFMLFPLIIDMQWKEVLVHPLRSGVYINEKPLSGSTFPGAPKGGVQVPSDSGDVAIAQSQRK
jgi:hypothetical protein